MHRMYAVHLHHAPTTEATMPSDLLSNLLSENVPPPSADDGGRVVALLKAGIPLSLLLDLAGCDPHSEELYELERAS